MAAPAGNQARQIEDSNVQWDPTPYTDPAKAVCNTAADVSCAVVNLGLKVGAKALATSKPKYAPVLDNVGPAIDACTEKASSAYKAGSAQVVDACFKTPQSFGSRAVTCFKK